MLRCRLTVDAGRVPDFRTPRPSHNDIVEVGCLGVTVNSVWECRGGKGRGDRWDHLGLGLNNFDTEPSRNQLGMSTVTGFPQTAKVDVDARTEVPPVPETISSRSANRRDSQRPIPSPWLTLGGMKPAKGLSGPCPESLTS